MNAGVDIGRELGREKQRIKLEFCKKWAVTVYVVQLKKCKYMYD